MPDKRNNRRKPRTTPEIAPVEVNVDAIPTKNPCETCVPKLEVDNMISSYEKTIAGLKTELHNTQRRVNSLVADNNILREKSESDSSAIKNLKNELSKVGRIGRWIYGINY